MNLSGKAMKWISKISAVKDSSKPTSETDALEKTSGTREKKVLSKGSPVPVGASETSETSKFEKGSWMKGVKDWVARTVACTLEIDISETSCYNVGKIVNPIAKKVCSKKKDEEDSSFIQIDKLDLKDDVYDPESHRAVNFAAVSEVISPETINPKTTK